MNLVIAGNSISRTPELAFQLYEDYFDNDDSGNLNFLEGGARTPLEISKRWAEIVSEGEPSVLRDLLMDRLLWRENHQRDMTDVHEIAKILYPGEENLNARRDLLLSEELLQNVKGEKEANQMLSLALTDSVTRQEEFAQELLDQWVKRDFITAGEWVKNLPKSPLRDSLAERFLGITSEAENPALPALRSALE